MGDDYSKSYKRSTTVVALRPQAAVDPYARLAGAVILAAFNEYRQACRGTNRAQMRKLEAWLLDEEEACHVLANITAERAAKGIASIQRDPKRSPLSSTGGNRRRDEPILIGKRGARRRQQCPVCGVHFYPKPRYNRPMPVYCSRTCSGIASRNEVEPRACLQCGKIYSPYRRNNLTQKYCSMKCSGLARRKKK